MAFASLTVDMNANFAALRTDFAAAVAASQAANQKIKDHLKETEAAAKKSGEAISKSFDAIKSGIALIGIGLGVHEIIAQFKEVEDSILAIGRASESTGISTEALSGLKLAAEAVSLPFDVLVAKLAKFDKALDTTNPALLRLGFSVKEIQQLAADPGNALARIADKFAGMENSAGKATIAQELFGRGAQVLIPLLNLGAEGFRKWQEAAEKAGLVVTPETVEGAKKFKEQVVLLNAAFEGFKHHIFEDILPGLTQTIVAFNEASAAAGRYSGIVHGLAQLGKVILFGADKDAIGQQEEFIETLRNEKTLLEGLKNTKDPELHANTEHRLAAIKISLEDAEKVLRRLRGLESEDVPKTKAPARPEDSAGASAKIKATLAAALALEKENASERLTILDDAHKQGLISEQDFYAARTDIAKKELGANLRAIESAIKEEKAALAKATPEQQDQIEAKLITLRGQRAVITKQLAFVDVKARQDETAAVKTLIDATEELNIQTLKSQGRTEEAAIAEEALNKTMVERARIVSNFKEGSLEVRAFDATRARAQAQARLNDLSGEANAIRDEELAKEIDIQAVLELSGHTIEAELHAIDATNAARKEEIELLTANLALQLQIAESSGNSAAVGQIRLQIAALNALSAKLDPLVVSMDKFAVAQRGVSDETRQAAIIEQHLQNLRETGSITTLQLLAQTDEARKQEVVRLTEVRDKLAAIAKTPDDLLKVRELTSQIETLSASANQFGHVFEDVFEQSGTSALDDFLDRTKTADEAFKSFLKNVLSGLNHIASQAIMQQLFGGATNNSSAFAGFASLFVGAAAGSASGGSGGGNFSGRMAEGGITSGRTLAGESGPEAVIPLSGGRSVPVKLQGGGGTNVYMTVITPDANSFRQSSLQMTNQLGAQIARAQQRK